jgi:hypothetical protein
LVFSIFQLRFFHTRPQIMSVLLLGLQADVLDYAKSMPERSVAEDADFGVWGKGFCERMVRFSDGFRGLRR